MKALTIKQPYASLVVHGIKTWETRPAPPNGDMRPDGVRGLPGLAINKGERIAIHAAAVEPEVQRLNPTVRVVESVDRKVLIVDVDKGWDDSYMHVVERSVCDLPLGAVVGTVVLGRVLPIVAADDWNIDSGFIENWDEGLSLYVPVKATGDLHSYPLTDQLPFGFWDAGNWAWELTNPIMFDEPIPATGKQGVWNWDGEP